MESAGSADPTLAISFLESLWYTCNSAGFRAFVFPVCSNRPLKVEAGIYFDNSLSEYLWFAERGSDFL